MSTRLKSVLRIGLGLFLALFFLYLAFSGVDFKKMYSSLKEANYFWALLLIPCLLISHLIRAWRWKYLLEPIKKDISFRNLFSSLMVGYMVNNLLPRVGEVVRPYNLGRLEKTSMSAVLGTVFVERIIDVLLFLFLLAVIFNFYQSSLARIFPWIENAGIILGIVTVGFLGIFGLLLVMRDPVFRWLRKWTRHLPPAIAGKFERLLHSFLDGFLIMGEPRRYGIIILLSFVIWFWYALMVYFPFYAFGMVERYSLNFATAGVVVVISSIGVIIPAPGGTGSYHWIAKETLARLFGVNVEIALSYATVTHLLGYVSVILVGLFYFLRDNLKFSEAIRDASQGQREVELMSEKKM